jgi:hypothetical protein
MAEDLNLHNHIAEFLKQPVLRRVSISTDSVVILHQLSSSLALLIRRQQNTVDPLNHLGGDGIRI